MFTLYVAPNKRRPTQHDVGSVLCMKTLQNVPEGIVRVLNCTTLSSYPSFLRGTPTLVDDETSEIYTGHNAMHRLQLLSLYHAEQYGKAQASRTTTDPRPAVRRGGSATVPSQTRPPSSVTAEHDHDLTEDEHDMSSMWSCTIDDSEVENEAEQTLGGGRKLTSDDLSRALSDRNPTTNQTPSTAPPPPPPPLND